MDIRTLPYARRINLQIRVVTPQYSLSSSTAIDGKCFENSKAGLSIESSAYQRARKPHMLWKSSSAFSRLVSSPNPQDQPEVLPHKVT